MNKYEVLSTIGEGAYGVVVKARNKENGELVAIKRFKESEDDEAVKKTSLREVKVLRLMKDEPYIVTLHEAFRRKGRLYLVFPYVGKNLLEELEGQPQGLDPEAVRKMIFSLLCAIYACHSKGIIHRDIKPENLLVSGDGSLRLCDFGFARPYSRGDKDLTDYVATRWYRSPELLLGTSDYGLPSDIWAVGCIMAELLDGQALFPGETELDQLFLIQGMLGSFTAEQIAIFKANPRFAGVNLPPAPKAPDNTLERRFSNRKISKRAIAFLKNLMQVNPALRPTVEEAMRNPYFEGLCDLMCPSLKSILHPDVLSGPGARPPSPVPPPTVPPVNRPSTAGQRLLTEPQPPPPPPASQGLLYNFDSQLPPNPSPSPFSLLPQGLPTSNVGLRGTLFPGSNTEKNPSLLMHPSSVTSAPAIAPQLPNPKRLGSGNQAHRVKPNPNVVATTPTTTGPTPSRTRSQSKEKDYDPESEISGGGPSLPLSSMSINSGPSIPPMTTQSNSNASIGSSFSYQTYQPLVIGGRGAIAMASRNRDSSQDRERDRSNLPRLGSNQTTAQSGAGVGTVTGTGAGVGLGGGSAFMRSLATGPGSMHDQQGSASSFGGQPKPQSRGRFFHQL